MNTPSRYHWMSWLSQMLCDLRKGNLKSAANMLNCCLLYRFRTTDVDLWGANKMFKHPELAGKHEELWRLMQPMTATEDQPQAVSELRSYGWEIQIEQPSENK